MNAQLRPVGDAPTFRDRMAAMMNRNPGGGGPWIILLAGMVGLLAGYGAVAFTWLIDTVGSLTLEPVLGIEHAVTRGFGLFTVPAIGLLLVAWVTRRFAPEAQGHGVPEVILAVARRDGKIRPRVSVVKILASGLCIGTGGSIGREGPIVQIGSALGSMSGQYFHLSARNIKVLVAAGAAAGISATFHAPLAGVIFSSEIILGSFAVESLTPIVIAAVLADVVQQQIGEHGTHSAFIQLEYAFNGEFTQLPTYLLLGLTCGLFAVGFTRLVYAVEDWGAAWIHRWWLRALVAGGLLGLVGVLYPTLPPVQSAEAIHNEAQGHHTLPPIFGVGYGVVDHTLHLERADRPGDVPDSENDTSQATTASATSRSKHARPSGAAESKKTVQLSGEQLWAELWWLLPLAFLKPLMTSITLAGGGSGGIFAPSLFIGATVGASFGVICNLVVPEWSAHPGEYAIVGMGAVVAGTTHGVLSAILIVYEMTNDYRIILPIMAAAGISCVIAKYIDPDSIYHKKLNRRGENLARGHEMSQMEHVMVRDVMIEEFPMIMNTDNIPAINRIARKNPKFDSFPVMDEAGRLVGIIRPEELHRVQDTDMPPTLVYADEIAVPSTLSVSPDENLLEAIRDFSQRDIETLPVETGKGADRRLIGLLLREDVMQCYREEMRRFTPERKSASSGRS
ncbi:MAG: chloride channel protein [Planctomycetota bacterium]|nr:chloride channel protein [Planctomycetota bacterium]